MNGSEDTARPAEPREPAARRRSGLRVALAAAAVVATAAGVVVGSHLLARPAGRPARADPAPAGPRPVAPGGRFSQPWSLDGGRFRVEVPPTGQAPRHTRAEAVTAMHTATDRYWLTAVHSSEAGAAVDGGAGYGLVTLGLPVGDGDSGPSVPLVQGAGDYHRRPAWVVWYRVVNAVAACPAMGTGRPPAGQLPDPNAAWEVFVLPDQVDGAVRYRASVASCGRTLPATAWVAAQHLGVAWRVAGRHGDHYTLRYTLPGCAALAVTDGEGDGRTARFTIVIAQTFARLPCPAPTERTVDYHAQPGAHLVPGPVGLLPVGG
jgi:hypothetical protein